MPEKKKLYLVDGMAHIFRAFYAIRGLSNSKGMATNAIFGVTTMLRKLIADEKPDYLAFVLDSAEPTFRHEAFEAYKANRQAFPEDLSPQMPYIIQLCEAMRIPIARNPGFEADDIIGTLAKRASKDGITTIIVSNDKDMCQLVNDKVFILRADKTGNSLLDAKKVEEKMGVRPDQIIDLLGLWGDSSDNIPGAPGVGEKGALQIIQQFGSLEEALKRHEEITRKTYRESLRDNQDLIRQSKHLATIHCDCPCDYTIESLKVQEPDRAAAYQLFKELDFAGLSREFADAASPVAAAEARRASGELSYKKLKRVGDLRKLNETIWSHDSFSFAVYEDAGSARGIAISIGAGEASLIDFTDFDEEDGVLKMVKDLLSNGLMRKSVHDWKTSLHVLNRRGLKLGQDTLFPLHEEKDAAAEVSVDGLEDDTILYAYLLDSNRLHHKIEDIAREYLGFDPLAKMDGFTEGEFLALRNADLTGQVADVLRNKLEATDLLPVYQEIELPLVPVLFDMEACGVMLDEKVLTEISKEIDKEINRLSKEIFTIANREFNINSPTQLAEVLEELNIEVGKKTKTGKVSTSADVLEELAEQYELPRLVLDYRELTKLQSTYVVALPKSIDPRTGRIHTTFNQTIAATGRLSSINPNLQNIPVRSQIGKRIRAAFVPAKGCQILSADYSQIELRLLAHIAQDPAMTASFRNNEDVHAATAEAVFGAKTKKEQGEKRRLAKIVNFAIAYSVGAFGLAQRTGLSRKEAKEVIDNYFATYPGIKRYMDEIPEKAREGGVVRTLSGRIRPIPDINSANHGLRARAEREAINAPIQGTAADIIKIAMIRIAEALKREHLKTKMILQVHDELVFEVPKDEIDRVRVLVKDLMESAMELDVPLVVDVGVGKNWMEAKP